MARPTHASAPSRASNKAASAKSTANTPSPPSVASVRLRGTTPRTIAGTASTGNASTTAKTSRLAAVRPATARARSTPAWTSILYWSAAPSAPPPGAIFASAFPASCDAITGRQGRTWIASRCSSHRLTSDAACSAAITANHHGAS